MDAVSLARDLVRCNSVTPADGGAQAVLINALEGQGFSVTKLKYGNIENFFAERPGPGAHLCFAGHTDVVPPGEGLTGTAVAGAILLAAAQEPKAIDAHYRQFLGYGVNIAEGGTGRAPATARTRPPVAPSRANGTPAALARSAIGSELRAVMT